MVHQLHLGTVFSVEGERYERAGLTSSREPKLVGSSQGGLLLGPVDGNPRHDGTSRSEPGLPLCSCDMCPHSHYCTAYPHTNFSNPSLLHMAVLTLHHVVGPKRQARVTKK